MTSRREHFVVGDRPEIVVGLPSGRVHVVNGAPDAVVVDVTGPLVDEFEITQVGDQVTVRWTPARRIVRGSHRVRIEVPDRTALTANLASADLDVETVASLDVRLASGDVRARTVHGDASVKSASGDVEIELVGGKLNAATASGDIVVDHCVGDCSCASASGDLTVRTAGGDVSMRSASGDVHVERFEGRTFRGKTMSGDARIDLPAGRTLEVDLVSMSGRCRLPDPSPNPAEGDRPVVELVFKSVSGNIDVGVAP